jgi:DNA polymerase-3 subunit gamma/tau
VDLGYDLRLVCRELSRVVRDLLILNVDPSRASDPEIAGEAERETVLALAARFSREDLLRAFDLLTRAEFDIRAAAQPRYHLEMALLRWMHLRKLLPIEELIAGASSGVRRQPDKTGVGGVRPALSTQPQRSAPVSASPATATPAPLASSGPRFSSGGEPSAGVVPRAQTVAAPPSRPAPALAPSPARPVAPAPSPVSPEPVGGRADFKDAFLAEIRKSKHVFYNAVVVQAQKIEVTADRVTFSFSSSQRALRDNCEQNRAWLEAAAQKISGRRIAVTAVLPETSAASSIGTPPVDATGAKKIELREQALADAGVQALLEVFPAEIRDVEEM